MKKAAPAKRKPPLVTEYLPSWTQRAVIEATGRDPLGLANVSNRVITDFLLPGITTQTSRARYYSFYVWSLWHIQQTQPPKRFGDFQEYFQRRESAFAIATVLHGEKNSPVGVDTVNKHLDHARAEGEINTAFQVLQNPLGGYGQYYVGSLKNLGLVMSREHADVALDGMGTQLAEAFHASVVGTPYIRKQHFKEVRVPLEDLEASSKAYNLNAIRWEAGKQERLLLKQLFFELDDNGEAGRLKNRRWSLMQILHLLDLYEQRGIKIADEDLDDVLIYWPHYYGLLFESKRKPIRYSSPASCESVHALWRQFVLHQFTTLALEYLLRAMLDTLAIHRNGLELEELIRELLSPEFYAALKRRAGSACVRPKDLLARIGVSEVPDEKTSVALQNTLIPGHTHSEVAWMDDEASTPAGWLVSGIGLLAVLYGKWRGIQSDKAFHDVAKAAGNELWFGSLAGTLDHWLDEGVNWEVCLFELLSRFILERHDQVMYQKGRLDSCWINRTGGKLTKEQDIWPDVHASRHYNALTILEDLCLVEHGEGTIHVTAEGRRLMTSLLKEENRK
jgi:hypothetical protein